MSALWTMYCKLKKHFTKDFVYNSGPQPFCNRGPVNAWQFDRGPGVLHDGCCFSTGNSWKGFTGLNHQAKPLHAQKASVVTTDIHFVISRPGTNRAARGLETTGLEYASLLDCLISKYVKYNCILRQHTHILLFLLTSNFLNTKVVPSFRYPSLW